jgi:hypothetical protein
MKFNTHKSNALFLVALLAGCVIILCSCNELINKAKQLIPDAGSQYNASEEFRRAQGDTTIAQRPYVPNNENETDYTIEDVKQLIPDPGPQYNAAEELRWAQGKSDKIPPYAPKGAFTPSTANKGCYYTLRWNKAPNATQYCVNWSFFNKKGEKKEGTSNWISKLEHGWIVPNETGKMYVNVSAKNSGGRSRDSLVYEVTVKEGKNGQLIFLTHGLNGDVSCFQKTANSLSQNSSYFDFGYITKRKSGNFLDTYYDIKQTVDEKICQGTNVLVKVEFSAGNLSFANQLTEMEAMLKEFEGHHANVVFIGHSMGGLASINYVVNNSATLSGKKVKIITVDTPYQPNNYAKYVWDPSSLPEIFLGLIGTTLGGQVKGKAHRDLGGFGTALSDLKKNWNKYLGDAKLYAVSVSLYSKLELRWKAIGDGIVDIPAQQGDFRKNLDNVGKWERVNKRDIIFGTGISTIGFDIVAAVLSGNFFIFLFCDDGGVNDKNKQSYHTNTPSMPQVIDEIKKIIEL